MEKYNFIIVGAGSAGCVLANRLSADPSCRVLLIEAGPNDSNFFIGMPKGFGKLLSDPRYCHFYATNHGHRYGGGRADVWLRGKVLGGSSAVNGQVYHRGQPQDYDSLASSGLSGWSWKNMLRCFLSLENHALPSTEFRGKGGPIDIRIHPAPTPLSEAMIAAGRQIGLPVKEDPNLPEQEGVSYVASNINPKGQRVSAAKGFLTPAVRDRSNLHILTKTTVERVLFDGKRAIGVVCKRANKTTEFFANEVILSAGTVGSPHLLQVSGVGPAEHLRSIGVEVVHDSPEVGANLREHWVAFMQFRLRHRVDSQNDQFSGFKLLRNLLRYVFSRSGPLSIGGYDLVAFIRTNPQLDRPDAQLTFAPYSLIQTHDGSASTEFESEPGMQFFGYPMRTTSQGSVMAISSDPHVPPAISPNYLDTDYDQRTMVGTVRFIREFMSQPALRPFVLDELDVTSGARTDDEILDFVRKFGQVGFHAVGTCRMGVDDRAVLDERLRVRGVDGVRVVDCSIFPEQLSGNTNGPAMAAGWRASELILEDLKKVTSNPNASSNATELSSYESAYLLGFF